LLRDREDYASASLRRRETNKPFRRHPYCLHNRTSDCARLTTSQDRAHIAAVEHVGTLAYVAGTGKHWITRQRAISAGLVVLSGAVLAAWYQFNAAST